MHTHGVTDVRNLAPDSLQISVNNFIETKARGKMSFPKLDALQKTVDQIVQHPIFVGNTSSPELFINNQISDLQQSLRKQAGL